MADDVDVVVDCEEDEGKEIDEVRDTDCKWSVRLREWLSDAVLLLSIGELPVILVD